MNMSQILIKLCLWRYAFSSYDWMLLWGSRGLQLPSMKYWFWKLMTLSNVPGWRIGLLCYRSLLSNVGIILDLWILKILNACLYREGKAHIFSKNKSKQEKSLHERGCYKFVENLICSWLDIEGIIYFSVQPLIFGRTT